MHFLFIARASLFELLTLLELAARCGYLNDIDLAETDELTDHVGRMLTRLAYKLRAQP